MHSRFLTVVNGYEKFFIAIMYFLFLPSVFVLFSLCELVINHFCSQLQLASQFCPFASPLRGSPKRHDISIHHHSTLLLASHLSSLLSLLSKMDSLITKQNASTLEPQNSRHCALEPAPTSTTSSVGEIDGRVDKLALVQQTLRNGATPTMIAGFAMIIAQMQLQAAHPDVLLRSPESSCR